MGNFEDYRLQGGSLWNLWVKNYEKPGRIWA